VALPADKKRMPKNKDHHNATAGAVVKNTILFSFNNALLKELRKVLFARGLSPQEFFSYIIERLSMRDSRLEDFLFEAAEIKQKNLIAGNIDKKHRDAASLYDAIEKENKQQKE
jgi:hypothetical protein